MVKADENQAARALWRLILEAVSIIVYLWIWLESNFFLSVHGYGIEDYLIVQYFAPV